MMKSKEFQERTEAWLNLGKLLALFCAGLWIVYQWNASIFPREALDDFERRAKLRTDITAIVDLDAGLDTVEYLDAEDDGDQDPAEPRRMMVVLDGELELSNPRDFPIVVRDPTAYLTVSVQDLEATATPGVVQWRPVIDWEPQSTDLFGLFEFPVVLEPNGSVQIPVFWQLAIQGSQELEDRARIEFVAKVQLDAVYPETGLVVGIPSKERSFGVHSVVNNRGVPRLNRILRNLRPEIRSHD